MEKLALDVEETVYLNLPNDTNSITIDRIESPRNVKIIDRIGEIIPLHIGGANKTILANLPPSEIERILGQLIPTEHKREAFKNELHDVKRKGYAVSYGERTKGTIAVGAPIFNFDDRVLGAISIEVLSYDITDDRLAFFIEKAYEVTHQISSRLRGE